MSHTDRTQLPQWLRELAEEQAKAEDWPNKQYPHVAFRAREIVAEDRDGDDAQVCLLQVVIDERQAIVDDLVDVCKILLTALGEGQIDKRSQPFGERITYAKILCDVITKATGAQP